MLNFQPSFSTDLFPTHSCDSTVVRGEMHALMPGVLGETRFVDILLVPKVFSAFFYMGDELDKKSLTPQLPSSNQSVN